MKRAAVNKNEHYCDLGYPRISYFAKKLTIGCGVNLADISSKEILEAYFSESVEFNRLVKYGGIFKNG